jgi:Fe-S-cluster containining protein
MDSIKEPWYAEGLRFRCTGCGQCCTGSPGYVFLSETDLLLLARHMKIEAEAFAHHYVRRVEGRLALIDKAGSEDCVFLENKQCTVYEARPVQCRTFPWWVSHLETPEDWRAAAERCEGIEHPDAPVVSALEIQRQCLTYLDSLLEQNF